MAPCGHEQGVGSYGERSDRDLWYEAVGHDGGAFGLIFRRHAPTVYNHCFRRTASWADAEDLTSVVFLEAWRRRKDVRFYSESVLPWLLAVANNAVRNARRSTRRHQRFLATLPPPADVGDFADQAVQRADDERAMGSILAAVADLRIEEQEAIALCDWAGLSYAAAAGALGIPAGTIRSRLSRAHSHLRDRVVLSSGTGDPFSPMSTISQEER